MKENINNQEGAIIRTLHSSNVAYARIYSEEQRMRIKQLIQHNFLPHHTSVGVGKIYEKALEPGEVPRQIWSGV